MSSIIKQHTPPLYPLVDCCAVLDDRPHLSEAALQENKECDIFLWQAATDIILAPEIR